VIERELASDRIAAVRGFWKTRRDTLCQFLDVTTDPSVDAVLDDFLDSPAGKRQDRRATCHRFDHDEPERLLPLNGEQECPRAGQQRIFLRGVRFANVFDQPAIDARHDLRFPILAKHGLDFTGELQANTSAARRFDRKVRGLAGGHAAEEDDVIVLRFRKRIVVDRDAVVDDLEPGHGLAARQPRSDSDVFDIRISGVLLGQHWLVRMMHRRHDRQIDEPREWDADDIVEMHQVRARCCILYGPRRVIDVLEFRTNRVLDRPVRVWITPAHRARKA